MNKIFNFNKKNLTEEEKIKQDKLKLLLYLVFFVILIVVVRISNKNNVKVNNPTDETPKVDEVISLLEPLKNNNYEVNLNIIIDNDLINIVKRMNNLDSEIFYISYRGEESAYYRYKEIYYILNNEEITKTNEYKKLFDYDETFLDINNLIKVLEEASYIDLEEESYNIRRYKITLNDVLSIYNEINNTKEFTSLNKEIVIDVRYKNSLKGIYMNITDFNNYIEKTEYSKVTYELTFDDINNVNLKSLEESTN